MSPEALVEELRKYAFDNGLAGPWLGERIRALLDAYAAARAERDEALDALDAQVKYGCLCAVAEEGDPGVCGQCAMTRAVLVKAGRR